MGRKRRPCHQADAGGDAEWSDDAPAVTLPREAHPELVVVASTLASRSWDEAARPPARGGKQRWRGGKGGSRGDPPMRHGGVAVPAKYWRRRNLLWAGFDALEAAAAGGVQRGGSSSSSSTSAASVAALPGIRMDLEGWYSVTPHAAAAHIARRMAVEATGSTGGSADAAALSSSLAPAAPTPAHSGGGVVLDLFCGCGGNAVAFARQTGVTRVVAVELDGARLAMARHNAALCGVPPGRIAWVHGDAVELLLQALRAGATGAGADDSTAASSPLASPATDANSSASAAPFLAASDVHFSRDAATGRLLVTLPTADNAPPAPHPEPVAGVFLAPPWGGIDYARQAVFYLRRHITLESPHAAGVLAELAARGLQLSADEGDGGGGGSAAATNSGTLDRPAAAHDEGSSDSSDGDGIGSDDDDDDDDEAPAAGAGSAMSSTTSSGPVLDGVALLHAALAALAPRAAINGGTAAVGYFMPRNTALPQVRAAVGAWLQTAPAAGAAQTDAASPAPPTTEPAVPAAPLPRATVEHLHLGASSPTPVAQLLYVRV